MELMIQPSTPPPQAPQNAEGSQRRPEGAEKRKEILSLFYSLC
jgi:hypothetical protein